MAATHSAQVQIILVVADTIRALGEVPSGELYARLMGHFSLATYDSIVAALINAGLVSKANHLLTWTGPAAEGR